ncbi:unnamed protein product, partial [Mesorhabditis spiculigera]
MASMDELSQSIDRDAERYVNLLRDFVAIPSISAELEHWPDCRKTTAYVKTFLEEKLHATTKFVPAGQKEVNGKMQEIPPILFAELGNAPGKKTLLVYGHLDVQPAAKEDGWDTDPFVLTEKDGKLYGRGSTDDKGPVLGWLIAIEKLNELKIEIPVNLKFVFESMEEVGSEGLPEALQSNKEFFKNVDYTCISDNYFLGKTKPCLTYGLRGINYFFVEITCAKQDLHSGCYGGSIPEAMTDLTWLMSTLVNVDGSINITGLSEMIAPLTDVEDAEYAKIDFDVADYKDTLGARGLTKKSKEELLKARWRYPSLSIHGIEGAFAGSGCKTVIPAKVVGKFSIRTVPDMTPEKVDACVVKHLNKLWETRGSPNQLKVTPQHAGRPWIANPFNENFLAGANAVKAIYGVEPDRTREGGSIPITVLFQEITGSDVLLLPIGASDDMAHSQNEKINRDNYIKGIKVMARYLLNLA